jgi:hypothetical protein
MKSMRYFRKRDTARGANWGLLVLPVATPEVVMHYVPSVLAVALLMSGIQLMMVRNFRVGSLIVGVSLGLLLSVGVIGQ